MTNGDQGDVFRRVSERDLLVAEDRVTVITRDEYNWIRYPRSGSTTIGWVCFGSAIGIVVLALGRWLAWLADSDRDTEPRPSPETWEYWTIGVALALAILFWAIGKRTSRRTRQAFAKYEAVFYPDEAQKRFGSRLRAIFTKDD